MRWAPVQGRGDMLPPRPTTPDWKHQIMLAGALHGRGGGYNWGYKLPNALAKWAEVANLRAMQDEEMQHEVLTQQPGYKNWLRQQQLLAGSRAGGFPRGASLPTPAMMSRNPPPPRPVVVRPAPWRPNVDWG